MRTELARLDLFARFLRAAAKDVRDHAWHRHTDNRAENALKSVEQVASELETIAKQEGPSDADVLVWACDRGIAFDKISGVCYARWVDDAMRAHVTSGATWRAVILGAMNENASIESAPDPAEASRG